MSIRYEDDVAAWAERQVALLRAHRWDLLDVEGIAEEIEDMNISHRHQLAHRMTKLLGHLLKWRYQPARRGASWECTIRNQRDRIAKLLHRMPSLRRLFGSEEWLVEVWEDALELAVHEAHLEIADLPAAMPWSVEQVLSQDYLPETN
ncbi:DUF29 domain-containing protein [Oxalobacteraceae bacterium OTU3CINTB1]|nr:DUF29 domain-containing protein [Oxalobacteraceae bacterium OTU3CINTB1]